MQTRSTVSLPALSPTISFTKKHKITWDNVGDDSSANEEILSMLLHMFRNVYVHDDNNGKPMPSILDVMFQVRQKTQMKIVNIELHQKMHSKEYTFLFDNEHEALEYHADEPGRARCIIGDKGEGKIASNYEVRTLYTDADSIKVITTTTGANVYSLSPDKTVKLYCYVLDAMVATSKLRAGNLFRIAAVDVSLRNVQQTKIERSVRYARQSEEYILNNGDEIVMKLYVEIQMRGKADHMANYMYGPFPVVCGESSLQSFREDAE